MKLDRREKKVQIQQVRNGSVSLQQDSVAVEEPLEIRIVFGPDDDRKTRILSVTMRTPGRDLELAVGFLISEGIVSQLDHLQATRLPATQSSTNIVEIELTPGVKFELAKLQRHFYTTSSCGVCGKTSLDAIRADNVSSIKSEILVSTELVCQLPARLKDRQAVFQRTGGLHAAGLADGAGQLLAIEEDIGRHNAVDKLIGSQLLTNSFPLSEQILVLSGRASFELMQKSLLASIPIVIAVGAPSSLAIELAEEFGVTLIGFASENRFNVYSNGERIV